MAEDPKERMEGDDPENEGVEYQNPQTGDIVEERYNSERYSNAWAKTVKLDPSKFENPEYAIRLMELKVNEIMDSLMKSKEDVPHFSDMNEFLAAKGVFELTSKLARPNDQDPELIRRTKQMFWNHPAFISLVSIDKRDPVDEGYDVDIVARVDEARVEEARVGADHPLVDALGLGKSQDFDAVWKVRAPSISLYVDPGSADAEDLTELYLALNNLYQLQGGSGLKFVNEGCKSIVGDLA